LGIWGSNYDTPASFREKFTRDFFVAIVQFNSSTPKQRGLRARQTTTE
jgi:hypothetical protein